MTVHADDEPTVTQSKPLGMQVCVPGAWTDADVEAFANRRIIAGTEQGWKVNEGLGRVTCERRGDRGFVHIVLDC